MIVVQTILLRKYLEVDVLGSDLIKESDAQDAKIADKLIKKIIAQLGMIITIYGFLFIYFKSQIFTEITGALSSGIEALLPLPQFINNWQKKSVSGVRCIY